MLGNRLRDIPRVGNAFVDSHPSSERLFTTNDKLVQLINSTFKVHRKGSKRLHSAISNNSHNHYVKMLETGAVGLLYDAPTLAFSAASILAYFGIEASSRLTETTTRMAGKALDTPGKFIEKKRPNSYLGKFHKFTSNIAKKTSHFFNNPHSIFLGCESLDISKDYFQIPKDIAMVALSLGLTYTVATTNYSEMKENITTKINDVTYAINKKIDEKTFDMKHFFREHIPNKSRSAKDDQYEIGILVGGSKDVLQSQDVLDIDVFLKKQGDLSDTAFVTARYYAIGSNEEMPEVGDWRFLRDAIPLGEQTFRVGDGFSGFFTYDPELSRSFDVDGAGINPLASNEADTTDFEFLVMLYDANGKKLTHKIWGEEGGITNDKLSFKFPKTEVIEDKEVIDNLVDDVVSVDGKKVFIYLQKLTSDYLKEDILTTADYIMPHYWDVKHAKSNVISDRVSTTFMKNYVDLAHKKDTKVLPMCSAFKKSFIDNMLADPKDFSKQIVENVVTVGADGVTIDLESIYVGSERSDKLVQFMKTLNAEFAKEERRSGKDYEIAIAVSPRFENSDRKGYRHHGFYDFNKLDVEAGVDWIHIMGYDFNIGKKGPNLPANKFGPVAQYAIDNVEDDSKIVYCFPFYGRSFNNAGREVGVLSERNNHTYLSKSSARTKMYDGELLITTKDPARTIYAQNPEVHRNRLALVDAYKGDIKAVGGWRASNTTAKSLKEYQKWKAQPFTFN